MRHAKDDMLAALKLIVSEKHDALHRRLEVLQAKNNAYGDRKDELKTRATSSPSNGDQEVAVDLMIEGIVLLQQTLELKKEETMIKQDMNAMVDYLLSAD